MGLLEADLACVQQCQILLKKIQPQGFILHLIGGGVWGDGGVTILIWLGRVHGEVFKAPKSVIRSIVGFIDADICMKCPFFAESLCYQINVSTRRYILKYSKSI